MAYVRFLLISVVALILNLCSSCLTLYQDDGCLPLDDSRFLKQVFQGPLLWILILRFRLQYGANDTICLLSVFP